MLITLAWLSPAAGHDRVFLARFLVWGSWHSWKRAMCIFENQIENVLGCDGSQHLYMALNQIVHVEPSDFKLHLLRIILMTLRRTWYLRRGLRLHSGSERARVFVRVLASLKTAVCWGGMLCRASRVCWLQSEKLLYLGNICAVFHPDDFYLSWKIKLFSDGFLKVWRRIS